eukprot:g1328.t1
MRFVSSATPSATLSEFQTLLQVREQYNKALAWTQGVLGPRCGRYIAHLHMLLSARPADLSNLNMSLDHALDGRAARGKLEATLMWLLLLLLSASFLAAPAHAQLAFSAGFTDDAVLQRDRFVAVYGFADTSTQLSVDVTDSNGTAYTVDAELTPWTGGAWGPDHGAWVWRATLRAAPAGGEYTIRVHNGTGHGIAIERVTRGDVFFCSGQSNMALETYFTFSADELKREIVEEGKFGGLRHFMYGSMGAPLQTWVAPQWATLQNTPTADAGNPTFVWHAASASAALPSLDNATGQHSAFAQFGATCMYFGAELIAARKRAGVDAAVPVGLIQAARGGSQIEAWIDNETLASACSEESLAGGAVPENSGGLYYGMIAPFANFSVAGWTWYQGENNVYGHMGNSAAGSGYGCELPAMVQAWRRVWGDTVAPDALFGTVTLAAGGSEGNGQHMGGMRWSQTANFGVLPNPALPHSFLAQAYDIGDPWAALGDGGSAGADPQHCALPDPRTGRRGANCSAWHVPAARTALAPLEALIRKNAPSGVPGNNFMGGIHPRLKRPVGRRLALAGLAQMLKRDRRDNAAAAGALAALGAETGPTIAGCRRARGGGGGAEDDDDDRIDITFNASLLGADAVLLQPGFETNASAWAGVDSLGAMVCASPAPAPGPAPAINCTQQCVAAGHCCVGLHSGDQQPSCAQGCAMAEFLLAHGASPTLNGSTTLEQCRNTCLEVPQHCNFDFRYNASLTPFTLMTCGGCGWAGAGNPPEWPAKPNGVPRFATCMSSNVGECLQGCAYAHGAPTAPFFPAANATTCGCRGWSTVPCDGGVKGQVDQWPCDPYNRTGAEFWYCEDGPGWKPPQPLRARGRALARRRAEARAGAARRGVRRTRARRAAGLGESESEINAPRNPFEAIWQPAPLVAGSGGSGNGNSVAIDLAAAGLAGAEVHAVRYAWPLGDDGDTCCPQASVTGNGDTVVAPCVPGSCPLLSAKSQLPANPFFARLTDAGKCECAAPQVCDA